MSHPECPTPTLHTDAGHTFFRKSSPVKNMGGGNSAADTEDTLFRKTGKENMFFLDFTLA